MSLELQQYLLLTAISTIHQNYSKFDVTYKNFPFTRKPRNGKVVKVRTYRKIGRNEICPCGSGKKFKRCCLKKRG